MCSNGNTAGKNGKLKTQVQKTEPGAPGLQDVVTALKDAGVLKGGEIGTAQSFLKFRNDSLHADWANVSRVLVEFCTAFIDAMLIKHFS